MPYQPGHLQAHPLPPGIVGALGIGGYQLLADVAGVGAGRIGSQVFLLVAPIPIPHCRGAGSIWAPRSRCTTPSSKTRPR